MSSFGPICHQKMTQSRARTDAFRRLVEIAKIFDDSAPYAVAPLAAKEASDREFRLWFFDTASSKHASCYMQALIGAVSKFQRAGDDEDDDDVCVMIFARLLTLLESTPERVKQYKAARRASVDEYTPSIEFFIKEFSLATAEFPVTTLV